MKINNLFRTDCLGAISDLQKLFLQIYLKRDYEKNHYHYEKQIHQKNIAILRSMQKTSNPSFRKLHEYVLAQGYLRFRIKDFTTLEIMSRELNELLNANMEKLDAIIFSLEELYHNTLQVVSAEPLAYLMFIQALKNFNEEMVKLKNG